jgi:hypothetical protein
MPSDFGPSIPIDRHPSPPPTPDWSNLVFGKNYAPHMFMLNWRDGMTRASFPTVRCP